MTNDSVKGYIMLTLRSLCYKKEEIDKILDELDYFFDTTTENEAERVYIFGDDK